MLTRAITKKDQETMDCLCISRLTSMLSCLFLITACINSSNEETIAEIDTRPTMAEFFGAQLETPTLNFSSEKMTNSVLAANQAALSFFKHEVNSSPESNHVLIPWPMFGTLALASSASHGDTAEELHLALSAFEPEPDWQNTYLALLQSQAALLSSGTGIIRQDLWSQFDSQFELNFLQHISSSFQARFHSTDFKSAEDIHDDVSNLATQYSGENYNVYLEEYANTRLMALSQLRIDGEFDLNTLQLELFEGLFENEAGDLIRTPMLRIQGDLGYYENHEFTAYRIPLSDNQLSLISIQPKEAMHEFIGNNLAGVVESLKGSWETKDTQAVLPVITIQNSNTGSWLAKWLDISLLYSERFANLRNMDRNGGLYMQGLDWSHGLEISEQGIALSGIAGHAVTFSPQNIFGPGDGNPINGSVTIIKTTIYFCIDATPDLSSGFLLVMDSESGLIHSVMQLKKLNGEFEGRRTNCIHVNWG